MKATRLILLTFLTGIACCCSLKAQQTENVKIFFEKVYLHTDRPSYAAGENIWFSAYLVNAQTGILSATSKTVYTELISPSAQIINRRVIRLEDGTGKGDFLIPDSLPAGNYKLRAYTNWMRNFGDTFIFEKTIPVYAIPVSSTEKPGTGAPVQKATAAPGPAVLKAASTVQFFPESGSMIEDVPGIMAFKASGPGKDFSVTGNIVDASGATLTTFECGADGAGAFQLTQAKGEHYRATGKFKDGAIFETLLPAALTQGFSMNVRTTDTLLNILVSTNAISLQQSAGKPFILVGKSKGKTGYAGRFNLADLQTGIAVPKSNFPPGITSLCLYDETGKPNCERLVFIEDKNPVKLSVLPDKTVYASKSKVTLNIKATGIQGQPVKTTLSVAVADANLLQGGNLDIVSYFLLQSEIKGEIKDAAHYFDPANPNRAKELDILLMTQGWRDFTWRRLADSALKITYVPEQGITVSGAVKNLPPAGANVSLAAMHAKGYKLFSTHTEADGRFYFDNLELYGKQPITITAMDATGKKIGKIAVDSVFALPLAVTPVKQETGQDTSSRSPAAGILAGLRKSIPKLNLSDTINLQEVQVKQKRQVRVFDYILTDVGYKDEFFKMKPADKEYKSLRQYLLANSSATSDDHFNLYFLGPRAAHVYPRLIINNGEIPNDPLMMADYQNYYLNFTMDKIKDVRIRRMLAPSIMSLGDASSATENAFGMGVSGMSTMSDITDVYLLYINFQPGALESKDPSIYTHEFATYYEPRTFYSPVYTSASPVTDNRSTIYWNPSVNTNENGEATLTFFTSDAKSGMQIVAEGVTTTGTAVKAAGAYQVK